MPNEPLPPHQQLGKKFGHALRGLRVAIAGRNGFGFHFLAALAVFAIAWLIECTYAEWLILALCVTAVIAAELFNTALEHLAKAVTKEENPDVRDALDVAAGAVLAVSIGAKVVWVAVLATRLFGGV